MYDGFLGFCIWKIKFDVINKPKYTRSKLRLNVIIVRHDNLTSIPFTEDF